MKIKIIAQDKDHLKRLIIQEMKLNGNNCDLNHIDVSQVNNMAHLFSYSKFNGDISEWNTSNVKNMNNMFESSQFNGNISQWNVSKVKYMSFMFECSQFNGDISEWKVSRVEEMNFMFLDAKFNGDISNWTPTKAKDISYMFDRCFIFKPYWAEIEDMDKRAEAIKIFIEKQKLGKKLSKELITNKKVEKKIKI